MLDTRRTLDGFTGSTVGGKLMSYFLQDLLMKFFVRCICIAVSCLAAASVQAQVTVTNAWVRATVPQQKATGAFMQLNAAQDTSLVSISSSVSAAAEVHEMSVQNDVMKMRQVPALALPAGKTVALQPGGFHVMLLDLKQPARAGDTVLLTLVFEGKDGKRESLEVKAPVRALNSAAAPAAATEHKH